MRRFAQLYSALDETTKTKAKVATLERYFEGAPPADAAWAVYLLSGRKIRQVIPIRKLCEWASEAAGIPDWLFGESYEAVGDLAETMTLVLPPGKSRSDRPLADWIENRLLPLRSKDESEQRRAMLEYWQSLSEHERLVLHKLITGAFRVGVSQRLVVRALSQVTGIAPEVIEHRMMGDWKPSTEFYESITDPDATDARHGKPYPFFLAHPIDGGPGQLGTIEDWQAEWKWDGIRAQLIRRMGEIHIWSRGDELMTDRFPELLDEANHLPDGTVLDGEILAWNRGALPFVVMQKRVGRKTLGPKILKEAPVVFMAFDLLEIDNEDVRQRSLHWRRTALEKLVRAPIPDRRLASPALLEDSPDDNPDEETASSSVARAASVGRETILLSPLVEAQTWGELERIWYTSREHNTEGLMLKRRQSPYGVGRPRGDWWKWKVAPYTVDAVLIYAQRGSGRRASLYTDYTFAVWDDDELVPFAKAYSGLTDDEIQEVDQFVRRHTIERFGPVRSVQPQHVFEIAFENIQESRRHKSGIAVRFPRISRWRRDKSIKEADTLDSLRQIISIHDGQ